MYHKKRLKLFCVLADFFKEISSSSVISRSEIVLLTARMEESQKFSGLSFLKKFNESYEDGCDIREIWTESVKTSDEFFYLDKSSREQLLYFSECFGKSGIEDFSCKCKVYSEMFNSYAQKEESKREKNASLYIGTSLFVAVAVFIIFV